MVICPAVFFDVIREEQAAMKTAIPFLMVPMILLSVGLAISASAHADEGMWVFNNLPLEQLKA